ncbi:MAG: hypothetical protein ACYDEJ_15935 [Desulfitobacteriaceae bacterium]
MYGYLRTDLTEFPALHRLNYDSVKWMKDFMTFLQQSLFTLVYGDGNNTQHRTLAYLGCQCANGNQQCANASKPGDHCHYQYIDKDFRSDHRAKYKKAVKNFILTAFCYY